MKVFDINLVKEVIAEIENSRPPDRSFTEEEKILAIERLLTDYENGKSRIAEYRQKLIENSILLRKLRNQKKFDNFIDDLEENTKRINSYEDDFVYLSYMLYLTMKLETSLLVRTENMGQEISNLMEKFDAPNRKFDSFEVIQLEASQIAEKAVEIDNAMKEVHILKIMNAYYQRLSHDVLMGDINLIYKTI